MSWPPDSKTTSRIPPMKWQSKQLPHYAVRLVSVRRLSDTSAMPSGKHERPGCHGRKSATSSARPVRRSGNGTAIRAPEPSWDNPDLFPAADPHDSDVTRGQRQSVRKVDRAQQVAAVAGEFHGIRAVVQQEHVIGVPSTSTYRFDTALGRSGNRLRQPGYRRLFRENALARFLVEARRDIHPSAFPQAVLRQGR